MGGGDPPALILQGDQTGLTGKHFDGDPQNARQ